MRLDRIRGRGKKIAGRFPLLYRPAQIGFLIVKTSLDAVIFKVRHRKCAYVLHLPPGIRRLRMRGYWSQYGQDFFLWEKYFSSLPAGFFVDIGSNHPTALSNTRFLEERGWKGIAVDPLSVFVDDWLTERPATRFLCAAVAEEPSRREFVEIHAHEGWEHALSGFREYVRKEDMDRYGFSSYEVSCGPLAQLAGESPSADFLSIDVEGAELEVLRGLDLPAISPLVVLVENVSVVGGNEELRRVMGTMGYDLTARIGSADDVFVRR